MATIVSKFSDGALSIITADRAGDVVVNDFYIDVKAADLAAGNVFDIGVLPAGHTVSDAILIPDDLDTGGSAALTLDVGIMSGEVGVADSTRTCGAEIFSASNAGQSGTPARATAKGAFTIKPTNADRSIGVKVNTAPATAADGRIRLRVFMHAADPALF